MEHEHEPLFDPDDEGVSEFDFEGWMPPPEADGHTRLLSQPEPGVALAASSFPWFPRTSWTTIPARPNKYNGTKSWLIYPCDTVIVHYVGSTGQLNTPSNIPQVLNNMQQYGWDRDGAGIEYNALTFPDGSTWGGFEGFVGAHAAATDARTGRAYNYSSWGLCWYGGIPDVPTDFEIQAVAQGILHGIRHGWVIPNPRILGHQNIDATQCPGALYPHLESIRRLVAGGTITPPADDDGSYDVKPIYIKAENRPEVYMFNEVTGKKRYVEWAEGQVLERTRDDFWNSIVEVSATVVDDIPNG